MFIVLLLLASGLVASLVWGFNLSSRLIATTAEKAVLEERLTAMQQRLADDATKQRLELEKMANDLLEAKTEQFAKVAKSDLSRLLEPLGKEIDSFRKLTTEQQQKAVLQYTRFEEQLKLMVLTGQTIGHQAETLAEALKTKSKTQGRWGEIVLERLLELSGLTKGVGFEMEVELKDRKGNKITREDDNRKLRPDAVVYLPEEKCIVIDAKVSLTAYVNAIEQNDPALLKAHVASVKKHIDELSEKHYERAVGSLDFVLMFTPNEAAYAAALAQDSSLWEYAYQKKVLLVAPCTLMVALRIAANLRTLEVRTKYADRLADVGGKLYNKLATFVDTLSSVRKHLENLNTALSKAESQLSTGRGNAIRLADELRHLGAETTKELSPELVDSALNELPDQDAPDSLP